MNFTVNTGLNAARKLALAGLCLCLVLPAQASTTLTQDQLRGVKRATLDSEAQRQQISKSAVLLANYEIEAKRLVRMTKQGRDSQVVAAQARELMTLSEVVIDSARFRLPQCDEYLALSVGLREHLASITRERLESDYHHDGALPEAPAECYHAKDLFVHPATVVILARDDPEMGEQTRDSIQAEIIEVLAHTEYVRQLVMY